MKELNKENIKKVIYVILGLVIVYALYKLYQNYESSSNTESSSSTSDALSSSVNSSSYSPPVADYGSYETLAPIDFNLSNTSDAQTGVAASYNSFINDNVGNKTSTDLATELNNLSFNSSNPAFTASNPNLTLSDTGAVLKNLKIKVNDNLNYQPITAPPALQPGDHFINNPNPTPYAKDMLVDNFVSNLFGI